MAREHSLLEKEPLKAHRCFSTAKTPYRAFIAEELKTSSDIAPGTKVFLLLFFQKKKNLLFLKKKKQKDF
jgi:hypothetical protein